MMKKNKFLLFSLFICLFALDAFGQNGKNDPPQGNNPYDLPPSVAAQDRQRRRMDEQHGRDKNGMMIQTPVRNRVPEMTAEQREIFEERMRNYENTLRRLQAPAVYYEKYETFLKKGKTGLARLFVDRNCDGGKTVSVEELDRCGDFIPVKGGGSYYSFRVGRNDGYLRDWWDIHFINEKLKVGNDSVQTIIADVGDVDLETLDLDSEAFEFLKKYKAKATVEEIEKQNEVLEKGINFNNFTYSNLVPANLNSTYVLRSVAYLLEENTPVASDRINSVNRFYSSGRGMDITVAFRIVGREKDGSLILLWKELKMDLPRKRLK